jgi:glutamate dehydrogenase
MVPPEQTQPFGVFFVHGDCFDGFHNRFQNIARGGLRLVTPPSHEQCLAESSRIYDEVYGLSSAQELKNKDIPEGGSKAVVLVDVARAYDGYVATRAALKFFTNSILDLIVTTGSTKGFMVDRLGVDEPIFLGPDEQVIAEDINWIIQQAGRRGYSVPAAFMSSKPKAGINHKTYGVTSEGVSVFLDVALRDSGIEPDKQPFTIKITGGPDGDVGGNLLRILIRDYGNNMRCVGIADGSGCVEDPKGLDHSELLRLFEGALPICDIDPKSLSEQGAVHGASTEEGVKMRNTMHNRVKADVFVPAGGRPNTMHEGNWEQFLDPTTGKPSSPLIVEGANIFITPGARQLLFDKAGVRIVKDSSANKCGVITSSFEICASMLLDEEEFLAIKDGVVKDVLKRLRELAQLEAELLFREYKNYPGALPHFSERISKSINRAYAAIRKKFADIQVGDAMYENLLPLFLDEYLPRKLSEVAGNRVRDRIPVDYLRNAFGKILASKLLYREGIHFLESQPEDRLPDIAIRYMEEEKRVREFVGALEECNLNDTEKTQIGKLLKQGGARSLLGVY